MSFSRPLSTEAYFDPTAATLMIVTPRGVTLKEYEVPTEVLEKPLAQQETWVRTMIRKSGSTPSGRAQFYPYGFFYQVR